MRLTVNLHHSCNVMYMQTLPGSFNWAECGEGLTKLNNQPSGETVVPPILVGAARGAVLEFHLGIGT